MFVLLEPYTNMLSINLEPDETNLLYSLSEWITRLKDKDKMTKDESEFAEKLMKELEYFVLNDE